MDYSSAPPTVRAFYEKYPELKQPAPDPTYKCTITMDSWREPEPFVPPSPEFCKSFADTCYQRWLKEKREELITAANNSVSNSKVDRNPYKFVTFTIDPQHATSTQEEHFKKIVAITKSKTVKVEGYYGCMEYTLAGTRHYHVLFHYKINHKRGFNKGHLSNFWKFGNIDVQNVQFPISNSLKNLFQYIEKDEPNKPKKIIFGDKNSIPCPTDVPKDVPIVAAVPAL